MLLVEYNVLEKVQVITEGKGKNQRKKLRGKFQKCDEQNNNGRVYPRKILENQVKAIKEKIDDRSLVGALDHPSNDAIHLSQASHLITNLWVEKNGDVMGECEILSTPNGKIVEALLNDGVKIGISSRGLGSVSEGTNGKVVNEDFKLITFDLVSDPSTKGAFPAMSESMRENSQRAQEIVSKHKKDRVLLTMLESKIRDRLIKVSEEYDVTGEASQDAENERLMAYKRRRAAKKAARARAEARAKKSKQVPGPSPEEGRKALQARVGEAIVNRLKETGEVKRKNKEAKRERLKALGRKNPDSTLGQTVAARKAARHEPKFSGAATVRAGREAEKAKDAANTPVGVSKRNKLAARLEFDRDKKKNPPKKETGRTQSRAEYRNERVVVPDR